MDELRSEFKKLETIIKKQDSRIEKLEKKIESISLSRSQSLKNKNKSAPAKVNFKELTKNVKSNNKYVHGLDFSKYEKEIKIPIGKSRFTRIENA